jgi:hypothetical protein
MDSVTRYIISMIPRCLWVGSDLEASLAWSDGGLVMAISSNRKSGRPTGRTTAYQVPVQDR